MNTQCSLCHAPLYNTLDTYGPWDMPLCQPCWFGHLSDLRSLYERLVNNRQEAQQVQLEAYAEKVAR